MWPLPRERSHHHIHFHRFCSTRWRHHRVGSFHHFRVSLNPGFVNAHSPTGSISISMAASLSHMEIAAAVKWKQSIFFSEDQQTQWPSGGNSGVCFHSWFSSSNNHIWLFADPAKFKAWTCRRTGFLPASAGCLPLSPTSCTGQRDDRAKVKLSQHTCYICYKVYNYKNRINTYLENSFI